MIYLKNENIIIPNLLGIESSRYKLVMHNNVTNEEIILDASNLSNNELYYQFGIDASGMAQNEYTVSLYDDSSQCLGTFLAQNGISSYKDVSSFINDMHYIQFD